MTLDPDQGWGGDDVDLIGNHCEFTDDVTVTWDGDEIDYTFIDEDLIEATVPTGEDGDKVTVAVDTFDQCTAEFTYVEPDEEGEGDDTERNLTLDPDQGWEGDEVDLIGDNCEFTDDVTVTWDGDEIDYTFVDEDLLEVTAPEGQDGQTVTVVVDTFDDCTAEFTYAQPDDTGGGDDTTSDDTTSDDTTSDDTTSDDTTDDDGGTGDDTTGDDTTGDDTTGDDTTGDDTTGDDEETDVEEVAGRTITRLPGATRIETAIEVSQEMFDSADTVVLARSDLYPDALTGGPFAHSIDAPILLTPPKRLVPQTADEIQRLGANEVVLLGLTGALSEDVEDQVADLPGVGTDRIGGSDRFGTARRIANRLLAETDKTAFERAYLAEGAAEEDLTRGWPDPIAVSALASHEAEPILLTLNDLLPPATLDSLAEHDPAIVDIVGGKVAVGPEVVDEARNHTDATFTRDLAGDNRFHTSALIADRSVEVGMNPASLWLATGDNWPDGLVAGPTVARDGGVLLLVPKDTFDNAPHSLQWLQDTKASLPADTEQIIRILGGEAAISSQVVDELP